MDSIRRMLRENNIAIKHIAIGPGMLKGPDEALQEAAVFSYGPYTIVVRQNYGGTWL